MSLRGIFLSLLLAVFAVSASAADKRFKMEGGNTLSIKGGDDWVAGDTITTARHQSAACASTHVLSRAAPWRIRFACAFRRKTAASKYARSMSAAAATRL